MSANVLAPFALLALLIILGSPIAFALLISGMIGIYMTVGFEPLVGVIQSSPYDAVASFTLTTLPMFVLMAEFLTAGRFTRDIFEAGDKWLGHIRGGMAMAAVAGGVILAAVCGSSSAAAGTLAAAAYPEMKRLGYSPSFATGSLAIVGTLAIMIPPSIAFVFYGLLTEVSIGKLFLAGIVPGIITGISYVIVIAATVRLQKDAAPAIAPRPPLNARLASLIPIWPILLFLLFMFAGLYTGIVTPTEIGAVGAILALAFALIMKRMSAAAFKTAVVASTHNTVMIFTIIIGAGVFGIFMTLTGMTQSLLTFVEAAGLSRWTVLLSVVAIWIVLGFFLDQIAIQVLTVPIAVPLLVKLGFDPIWIGVLVVKTGEIGVVTPPMGLNVFVVSTVTKTPVGTVFRGVWPYVFSEIIVLAILIAFPILSLAMTRYAP